MKEPFIKSNPLIRSVLHKSFEQAMKDLGLPEIPQDMFMNEIKPYLRVAGSLFDDSQDTLNKLWRAIMRGEIIVTESEGETFLLYVRGRIGQKVIDIRFSCRLHTWHIDAVVSMHYQTIRSFPWIYRVAFAVSIVIAGVIGYAIHPSGASVLAASGGSTVNSSASAEAKTSVTGNATAGATTPPADSNGTVNGTANTTQPTPATNTAKTDASKQKTLTFTLKPGMSVHDVSMFLHAHNLIHEDAVKFDMVLKHAGIDRDIRPGKYTFKTGMTQNQILGVLKAKPSK
ncbi:MltG/YceG/YrrL family protein [Alicyclobacillus dauci]|uniref:Endolytic transglycosylase MltG n=1 Tax=Alicyclobacillus dauci TaxID=1475485 RepID=A0ABY6Z2T7_9BACL|nr:hypothetical protein [Alicyclobacillus dauci]WAH37208.1 endolytic transglycosylase MltG [Alicyclobacillus dauci]